MNDNDFSRLNPERVGVVLVVEDEPLIRLDICNALRDAGCLCIEKSSAEAAQTTLAMDKTVRVLVADVRLNGPMDGMQLMSWVRVARPDVKVILASGHMKWSELARSADAAFVKPFNVRQLVQSVKGLMDAAQTSLAG